MLFASAIGLDLQEGGPHRSRCSRGHAPVATIRHLPAIALATIIIPSPAAWGV